MLGALSEKGFLNLIRKWKANGISTHPSFRNNTGLRKFCDEQPNPPRPAVTHRNTRTRNITSACHNEKKDIPNWMPFITYSHQCGCCLKTGGQDQGAGTHVSYIQLVLLHSIVLKDSNSTAWTVPKHAYIQNLATKAA